MRGMRLHMHASIHICLNLSRGALVLHVTFCWKPLLAILQKVWQASNFIHENLNFASKRILAANLIFCFHLLDFSFGYWLPFIAHVIASDHTPTVKLAIACHIENSIVEACDDDTWRNVLITKPEVLSEIPSWHCH